MRTFDWSGSYPDPVSIAMLHWKALVSAALNEHSHLYATSESTHFSTMTDPFDAITAMGDQWEIRSDWVSSRGRCILATTGPQDVPHGVLCAWLDRPSRDMDVMAFTVAVGNSDNADQILATLASKCEQFVSEDPDALGVKFWSFNPMGGGVSYTRDIDAPFWGDETRINYAADLRAPLDRLMGMTGPPEAGRILLMHGPPGSGKTSLLRMIGHAWADWCTVEYVIDPDEFFANASYMTQVMLGDYYDEQWRLLVVEDADELISANAKQRSGQGTARLLNIADGMLGQGLRVMVCVTTNEPVEELHAAMVRPGRCFAEFEVGVLSADQANEWRDAHGLPASEGDATLAELWAEARGDTGHALLAAGARRRSAARPAPWPLQQVVPLIAGGVSDPTRYGTFTQG